MIALLTHARNRDNAHSGQRAGSCPTMRRIVATAEGPAMAGIASGTIKGSVR